MANSSNLMPIELLNARRTREERSENAKKAGKASGEARNQKANFKKALNLLLTAQVETEWTEQLQALGLDSTYESVINASMILQAAQGNVKAYEAIAKYAGQLNPEEETEETAHAWSIPITDITSDFVEPYRSIHAAFSGEENIREIVSKGGRGSIKSNFWAAVAEETIYQDPEAHVVYTRRYKVDLRGSVYNQFMKTVIRHGHLDDWEFTTSPMMARYKKTGQCVIFVGADKPISLKSYNLSFGYVKLLIHEECDEMAGIEQMDNIEDTFLRSDTPALDIKVFNPPKSKNNFMNQYVEECRKKAETRVFHSYYFNVPVKWLGKRFFERAEWFKIHKPRYYANNYMGEVTGTGGGIFENVEERVIPDEEISNMPYFDYGLDFGFEHPQAFIKSYYDRMKIFCTVWMKCIPNAAKIRPLHERLKNI